MKGLKLCFIVLIPFYFVITNLYAQSNPKSITLKCKNVLFRIEVESESIIRVTSTWNNSFSTRKSLSVIEQKSHTKWNKKEDHEFVTIDTDSLKVMINKNTGEIAFFNNHNKQILKANGINDNSFIEAEVQNEKTHNIQQNFTLTKDEALYGLGQFEDGVFNWRNRDVLLEQANRTAINPFLISTQGYGILWDNYSSSKFHDAQNETFFWSQVADQIDYYFVYGPAMDRVIAGYRKLTGQAPMFGKWAYGYWQSKERYQTGHELISIIEEYRKRNIPFDNIIQDWQYWGSGDYFSGMVWDKKRYANPKAIIDTIHSLHSHIIASIWPAFGPKSDIYLEMEKKGFLYNELHWNTGKVYDAYNPEARKIYWKYLKKGLFDKGIDGYWMDGSEPEFRCSDDRFATTQAILATGKNYLGTASRYLTPYSLMHTEGVYENQRAVENNKRVFILTRSAFAGQQRNGAVTWSGDTFATWDNLRVQVAAGINFSMSGIPYWNSDIGGFIVDSRFPGGCKNDAYRELYVRWFQFGAFCPMFRSHGTSTPREMWQFGDKGDWAYDALAKIDELHYRLMPYIYSTAWKVTKDGYSFIRGLMMDRTQDKNTYSASRQFMFGSSIMVSPVLKPMYHLPENPSVDITPDRIFSIDGKSAGADLSLFSGTEFNKLVLKRKTDASGIAWFGCVPLELDSSYSVKFEGQILSDNAGKYKFSLVTDGGLKFWLDDKLLIDSWDNTEDKTYSADIDLGGETKYNFKVEYKELHTNSASLKITWVKPELNNMDDKTIPVYLPKDEIWYNFWTGKSIQGGETIQADAPIDILPLYVPSGSIIPMGPNIQYAEQKADPIELRIYPGKDGSFNLYEDENDNYNYEKGIYSIIPIRWNNSKKELTIENRKGSFPGMLKQRTFSIVIVTENHGAGLDNTSIDKAVKYSGNKITLKFN